MPRCSTPGYATARECQVSAHVITFYALIKKSMFSCVSLCFHSENKLISALMTSDQGWKPGYLALGCQFQFRCVETQMSGFSFSLVSRL